MQPTVLLLAITHRLISCKLCRNCKAGWPAFCFLLYEKTIHWCPEYRTGVAFTRHRRLLAGQVMGSLRPRRAESDTH